MAFPGRPTPERYRLDDGLGRPSYQPQTESGYFPDRYRFWILAATVPKA